MHEDIMKSTTTDPCMTALRKYCIKLKNRTQDYQKEIDELRDVKVKLRILDFTVLSYRYGHSCLFDKTL